MFPCKAEIMSPMLLGAGTNVRRGRGGSILLDSFLDSDLTLLTDHVAEKGGAWTVRSGTPKINTNRLSETATVADGRYTQQSDRSDGTLQVTLRTSIVAGAFWGILFREADDQSALMCELEGGTFVSLYTRTAGGGYSSIGSVALVFLANTDYVMKAVMSGTSIKIYVDDVLKIDVVEATNQTETRHGFRIDTQTHLGARFDDWSMI